MGRHGSERILSRPSVEVMTTDHLTPEQRAASPTVPGMLGDNGWGFGMGVTTRRSGVGPGPGSFGSEGGLGALWSSDPREEMVTILMTQLAFSSPIGLTALFDFSTLAYQAIDD